VSFAAVDWFIILGYLVFAFGVGVWASRSASKGLTSYFAADRSLPWWWLGTSMVATTFAADTPLAITGITANSGIAGNWFWWSWALLHMAMTVFFAARWRKSGVLTDAELIELRYSGKPAAFLRAFKAFFLSIVVNCIILGWVFRAMSKIADPFIRWELLLPSAFWLGLQQVWPGWLIFDNLNNTLTVLAILAIVVAYASMGGIRGVILTDLFQFAAAMVGAVLFAWYALEKTNGVSGLLTSLRATYPNSEEILRFTPGLESVWLPFQIFLIYMLVQWWTRYDSDGSGYLAQRLMTAKTPKDATRGSLWFAVAFYGMRTWPWIIVALAALVLFPKGAETVFFAEGAQVASDREMGYPILMKLLLPPGVLGLLFASLLAAFMSTVDTHLNWGTSYLVNDIYKRFIHPNATQRQYVRVSRFCLVALAGVAVLIASQINSIEGAWKFLIAVGSGLGLPTILRWFWWRANAWTEIVSMISALIAACVLYPMFPDAKSEYILLAIVAISTTAMLIATFVTEPVGPARLKHFVKTVKPAGFWGHYSAGKMPIGNFRRLAGAWLAGCFGIYALLFGVGQLLLASKALGVGMLVASFYLLKLTLNWTEDAS